LLRDLRAALKRLNPELPTVAIESAVQMLTAFDSSRSLLQQNREFYSYIRDGVPIIYRNGQGQTKHIHAKVIDFSDGVGPDGKPHNRFLVVRELKIQGHRAPNYNRRADLVCFVNGLPLVFIELKAAYRNIRIGYEENLTDYMTEQVIPHAFHHNAFLIVSNGEKARYGSITSKWEHFNEWRRNDEKDKGRLDAKVLLDGMLKHDRLLDLIENFILFDDSRAGGTRKVIARNHQVLGVNNAVESVIRQEELKHRFPEREVTCYISPLRCLKDQEAISKAQMTASQCGPQESLPLVERAHPDLGKLGVFWHTQGSGKSYSMAFFVEKVRRHVPGKFTFVIMTDRDDLDDQIYRTFVGLGIADDNTPRAGSGIELEKLLHENHRLVFTLIQKFRREEPPKEPYSMRDDIIVISDEAHRTQAGKLARNMRLALPYASFIGFTGTPLFKYDHLTRRIFGGYISRYDFNRSREDGSTVGLVYESRGEKLGLSRLDLNDSIAEAIENADLDDDQNALLEKLLGKNYEVFTADDRLEKLACDFVEHCSTRWESGKSMLVCIDKITCARMFQHIIPLWEAKVSLLKGGLRELEGELVGSDAEKGAKLREELEKLRSRIAWMEETKIALVISEAQNEVRDFAKWGFDIVPHRVLLKQGFETPDGKKVDVESAFKNPDHPFRIAIVCAMWLTGFDVECLSTLYIDKPMKTHTLMQAIARANRVYPGKSCGLIVDYNGMLNSLQEALAMYALGDDADGGGAQIVAPIGEMLVALDQAIIEAEAHLRSQGFDPNRLIGTRGFERITALRDADNALHTSDETRRRFEIMARVVFERFKALLMEPSVFRYAERHDNIEAIYKRLSERVDSADVTNLLKELHRIVNQAIQTQDEGDEQVVGLTVDLSKIDFEKLSEEFSKKVARKNRTLEDVRALVESKLEQMLVRNPQRMDYYKRYQEIIADYNREKDRVTVEDTFRQLLELANDLDAEQKRAVEEGLSEDELALFDLLFKKEISKADRERIKQASRDLLASLRELLEQMPHWAKTPRTQAEVESFIADHVSENLPRPPYSEEDCIATAQQIYDFVWGRYARGLGTE